MFGRAWGEADDRFGTGSFVRHFYMLSGLSGEVNFGLEGNEVVGRNEGIFLRKDGFYRS